MLQQVMTRPGVIEFQEVPIPVPGKGQALVKLRCIGICGSDIHVWHGKHPFTSYPVTQGHEVCGEVAALGEGVSNLVLGQKVTLEPQVVCGTCHPCRHGKYNLCESLRVMGFQTTGAASEYFVADAARLTPLPEDMDVSQGAMIEPLAVAVHAVRRAGDLSGKGVVVLGAGPIGNLVAQTAKGLGAAKVLITDLSAWRLEKARACGIDVCVNTGAQDLGQAIHETFGPDKADVIFDCAGTNATMDQAIRHARKGSTLVLVAVFADKATVDLAVLNDHELDLNTSMMYRHEDYVTAIDLAREGKVRLAPLITDRFSFSQYADAYRFIDAHRETTLKVLIDLPN